MGSNGNTLAPRAAVPGASCVYGAAVPGEKRGRLSAEPDTGAAGMDTIFSGLNRWRGLGALISGSAPPARSFGRGAAGMDTIFSGLNRRRLGGCTDAWGQMSSSSSSRPLFIIAPLAPGLLAIVPGTLITSIAALPSVARKPLD